LRQFDFIRLAKRPVMFQTLVETIAFNGRG
jgi:hypothetical protein